jgi:hypothetical protein
MDEVIAFTTITQCDKLAIKCQELGEMEEYYIGLKEK